jgi:hypothetical protein
MPIPKKVKSKKDVSKVIEKEMKKFKKTGKIGTSKPKSTKAAQKQASAIAYSKARESGVKVPKKKASKTATAKESFENYVKHLLKESFGLFKKIVG